MALQVMHRRGGGERYRDEEGLDSHKLIRLESDVSR